MVDLVPFLFEKFRKCRDITPSILIILMSSVANRTGMIETGPESTSVSRPKDWVFPYMSRNRLCEIFREIIIYSLYDIKNICVPECPAKI
jgi:hypothetical protein